MKIGIIILPALISLATFASGYCQTLEYVTSEYWTGVNHIRVEEGQLKIELKE